MSTRPISRLLDLTRTGIPISHPDFGADATPVIATAGFIVAPTEHEAQAKARAYQESSDRDGYLAHTGLNWDPTAFPAQEKLPDHDQGRSRRHSAVDGDTTVGEFLSGFGDITRHPLFVVGTPGQAADAIEIWLDDLDIDGINLLQYHSYDTAKDFIELVVPVLRARGRLRTEYDEGESLRDRIFGLGDRLPDSHIATPKPQLIS